MEKKVTSRGFGCGICGEKFPDFDGLEHHMETNHREEMESEEEDLKEVEILIIKEHSEPREEKEHRMLYTPLAL